MSQAAKDESALGHAEAAAIIAGYEADRGAVAADPRAFVKRVKEWCDALQPEGEKP